MAKGDKGKTNDLLEQNRRNSQNIYDTATADSAAARTRADSLYNSLLNQVNTYGDTTRPGYEEFSRTGGVDPSLSRAIHGDQAAYRKFARTPISGAVKDRVRGGGVYDELARTGGYSESDKYDTMARATNIGKSLYSNLKDELGRNAASTGGFININPQLESLTRQSAFDANDASLNARLGLSDSIRAGRLAGAGGMSDAERYLQSQEDSRFLGGMSGAMAGHAPLANLAGMTQSGRLAGLGGLSDIDRARITAGMGLYGSTPAEVDMYNRLRLGATGQIDTNISGRQHGRSTFDNILGAVGVAGSLFSPIDIN